MARTGPKPYKHIQKACTACGEEMSVTLFPKRGGTYKKLQLHDPRRYDSQCKACKAPINSKFLDNPDYVPPNRRKDWELVQTTNARSQRKYVARKNKEREARRRKANAMTPQERRKAMQVRTRIASFKYLSGKGCEKCGERDPRKLEYDHINPGNKGSHVSRLILSGHSWSSSALRAEIRKCRILCASCHRLHTIKQQGYHSDPAVIEALIVILKKYGIEDADLY